MKKQNPASANRGVKITRRERRSLKRNEQFKEDAARILRIDFTETIDPDTLYEGIMESFSRHTGEIHITLTKEASSNTHFASMPLDSAYGLMRDYAKEWAKGFMEAMDEQVAKETLSPEERTAARGEEIAALRKARDDENRQTLEYFRSLRAKVLDPQQRERWVKELDAMIYELENPKAVS